MRFSRSETPYPEIGIGPENSHIIVSSKVSPLSRIVCQVLSNVYKFDMGLKYLNTRQLIMFIILGRQKFDTGKPIIWIIRE